MGETSTSILILAGFLHVSCAGVEYFIETGIKNHIALLRQTRQNQHVKADSSFLHDVHPNQLSQSMS